ncbi:zinc finger CCCH domain-containing protein 15 homolog [Tigriopus californicus]|uniref:zinc finger CCCH domain-containing protein 15 homolog n=1 Tax=Tigriopus californicus TaxID=6832 RepID=UPI0027DAAF31|nr:zinc finger CCCH domain-containing protein 15 homolog [Tigriopus californicus]
MPPKKAPGPSKKTEAKKKERVIEDKTFGLKNKKGAKQQRFISQVEKQVKAGGDPKARKAELDRAEEKKKREEAKRLLEEENKLFKPVAAVQKVEAGVDPKSIFCAFFKQGLCKKGNKCKFSHDPAVEGKVAKRNFYEDTEENDGEEGMEGWDQTTLNEVISKKHGSEKSNATTIICKFFIDAVENNKYGWFWQCPNGGKDCMYKHALPPDYVLKKDKKKLDEDHDEISLEELIEEKRAELSKRSDLTKVTLQTFVQWKKRKLKERSLAEKRDSKKKKDDYLAGGKTGLSGREMFMFDPKMVAEEDDEDDGEAFDLSKMERDYDEDRSVKIHEIKFDEYGIMDDGLDESTNDQLARLKDTSSGKVEMVPIDEDLFEDEDLDDLEDDLTNLDV